MVGAERADGETRETEAVLGDLVAAVERRLEEGLREGVGLDGAGVAREDAVCDDEVRGREEHEGDADGERVRRGEELAKEEDERDGHERRDPEEVAVVAHLVHVAVRHALEELERAREHGHDDEPRVERAARREDRGHHEAHPERVALRAPAPRRLVHRRVDRADEHLRHRAVVAAVRDHDGRLAVVVDRRDARARVHERRARLPRRARTRPVQRRLAAPVGRVERRADAQQEQHGLLVVLVRRPVQRRVPLVVHSVDLHAVVERVERERREAVLHREVRRVVAARVGRAHVRARAAQQVEHELVPAHRRPVQRRLPVLVARVEHGAARHQAVHNRDVAVVRRPVQRRRLCLVSAVQLQEKNRATRESDSDDEDVVGCSFGPTLTCSTRRQCWSALMEPSLHASKMSVPHEVCQRCEAQRRGCV